MTVYIAACLRDRHPDVALAISKSLAIAGVPLVEVPGTGNIWIRDWMPIPVGDHFVQFRIKADTVKYTILEVESKSLSYSRDPQEDLTFSDIILDGGNVVRSPDGKRVIMCEQTLRDNDFNPDIFQSRQDLSKSLSDLLEAEIIWIHNEPGDTLGHSDGCVAWIDNDAVFVNDTRSMRDVDSSSHTSELCRILEANEIRPVPFPYAYDLCRDITEDRFRQEHPHADDFNMATGYFINFLKVGNLVLYPTFGIDRDERCLDALLDAWPDANCVGIDCGYLSEEGGLLHCVSWSDD